MTYTLLEKPKEVAASKPLCPNRRWQPVVAPCGRGGWRIVARRANSRRRPGGRRGPPGGAALIRLLDDPQEQLRRSAIGALGAIGPAAASAIGPLVEKLLRTDSRNVRPSAARALVRIDGTGTVALPALMDALRDPSAGVRQSVAAALAGLEGPRRPRGTSASRRCRARLPHDGPPLGEGRAREDRAAVPEAGRIAALISGDQRSGNASRQVVSLRASRHWTTPRVAMNTENEVT